MSQWVIMVDKVGETLPVAFRTGDVTDVRVLVGGESSQRWAGILLTSMSEQDRRQDFLFKYQGSQDFANGALAIVVKALVSPCSVIQLEFSKIKTAGGEAYSLQSLDLPLAMPPAVKKK